jgi:hypothetical protein
MRTQDDEEIEKNQEEEKVRIKLSRADRRSGKSKNEGLISKSKAKTKEVRSQKKIATVRKSRF